MEYETHIHPFGPIFNGESRILILGSFPSVRSRQQHFYYGHPRNRFWQVIAALTGEEVPQSVPRKKDLLLAKKIALWDVIESCDIRGSSDSSIRHVVPVDLTALLEKAPIQSIFTNGKTAGALFRRFQEPLCGRGAITLPSTSPANAAYSLDRLIEEWAKVAHALGPAVCPASGEADSFTR